MINVEAHRIETKDNREAKRTKPALFGLNFGEVVVDLGITSSVAAIQQFAASQVHRDEALIGCAMERYRIANEKYPAEINALVPRYLPKLPFDVFAGEPLKYRLTDDGGYLLYSVGPNQADNGGKIIEGEGCDVKQEDLVWTIPGATDVAPPATETFGTP